MELKEHAFVSSGKHITEVLKPIFEKRLLIILEFQGFAQMGVSLFSFSKS